MKNLVVLTGAGMSAESGISTFRDAGGLWDRYPVEQVATPEGYQRDPALVINFYNERRKQLLEVKPNRGHELLAELEKSFHVTVMTQNIDNLHERAGSSHIIHLHGELTKVCSSRDPPAPQMILIIRCLYCLHPKMHPEIKNDSLIIILYIKSYLPFLNKLTIVMICDILF